MNRTQARQAAAARLAQQLGLDGNALFHGAMAAWSNLNPQSVAFDRALSVAAAVLAAADGPAAPARPEDRYDAGLARAVERAVELARALYARDEPEGCEDYARGLASLIAAAFRIPGRRDEIEDAITGRDTEAEDAADVAEAVAALAEGGEPVPAGQVWDELGLGGDEAARRSQAEVLSQARDTREHMRSWAAGEETHHGEAQEDA